MGQPPIPRAVAILATLLLSAAFNSFIRADTTTAPAAAEPRVASVTPAGTDLLVGIGAGDHLVGISFYDDNRLGVTGKPRIGDYDTIDWEKLAPLHAQILLTQHGDSRQQTGLEEHCAQLGIRVINLKIDVLQDIYDETPKIAEAVGESAKGAAAIANLQQRLKAVQDRVAGKPPVKTLIITSDNGLDIAGPNTFLDELLTIAGGQNAAASLNKRYATIDRELMMSLAPDVVVQLIPDGDKSPQVLARARQFWTTLPDLPAVKNNRVIILTDWYALEPGFRVGELAEKFANILHPQAKP